MGKFSRYLREDSAILLSQPSLPPFSVLPLAVYLAVHPLVFSVFPPPLLLVSAPATVVLASLLAFVLSYTLFSFRHPSPCFLPYALDPLGRPAQV